jgi:hypothetical protein
MKEIEGHEGYFVYENGDVWTTKRNRLLNKSYNNGYAKIIIKKDGVHHNKTVHRLVALAFIPNPENKPQVNHIDGNKANNHVSNLEWVNGSENNKHAFKLGLMRVTENCKRRVKEVLGRKVLNVKTGKIYLSVRDAAESANANKNTLYRKLKDGRSLKEYNLSFLNL